MTVRGRRLSRIQSVAVAVAVFLIAFTAPIALAWNQARAYEDPAVIVLGSGNDLSILITDGPARLLLATGDDPGGFGNALGKLRPVGRDRIDVLLLAGSTGDVTFLSRARRTAHARHVEAIGKPELAGVLGLPAEALLPTPRQFRLSAETSVTVETVELPDAEEGPSFAWRATIDHGATRIVVLSDGRVAGEFPRAGSTSALIVGGKDALDALDRVDTRLFIASAPAVSGKDVRRVVAAGARQRSYALRVFPGEAVRLAFVDGGLRLPSSAMQIDAVPSASPGSGP